MTGEGQNIAGVKVLLGVSGAVAAYKAVDLASKLAAAGAEIRTIMTEAACQLIRPKSFEAVTAGPVYTSLWSSQADYKIGHISLAQWADIIVVVPATANIIAKVANGICDDLLSTVICACWARPVLLAPAMNENMWANPAVQCNVKAVEQMGFALIGPEKGRLACGAEGTGRMSEPTAILEAIGKMAVKPAGRD